MTNNLWDAANSGDIQFRTEGVTVTQLRLDFAVTLVLDELGIIRIEAPFELTSAGVSVRVDPESRDNRVASAAEIADLLNRQLVDMRYDRNAQNLGLRFRDGLGIQVSALGDFEAWQFTGEKGAQIVCLPGGDLAIWEASN